MVRISGGIHRGRTLQVPRAGVRPTKDMVRQALFSAIGDSITGKRVLDLFAGSGAIGLDALSRGASAAVFIEMHPRTYEMLTRNLHALYPESSPLRRTVRADAFAWLRGFRENESFDLIVADPPYRPPEGEAWGASLTAALAGHPALRPGGLFVLEQHADEPVIDNPVLSVIKDARYGETRLVYYRQAEPADSREATS
ncbi:MAG TPA: 16S rRNA (guanine(966)-N(2))-methyltransferase RsmD [Kiritimatiellia bacterium]|nr:16S rRNA (guanine(966)-N(2))-methyltransferase RsmD [Kiritimatiellia bacterium]HMO99130.1 16S rRNA (guanine(966)-N(2))-methyltransferase RsmD [Kiritimatiellia bacterium]HMP95692.1 16S rRNA (guanine(966)-N(2))-methyltransferase RsmD [Kiritimatiellia bacterium]